MELFKLAEKMEKFFPWRMEGTSMLPNVLLMCKLMFILLMAHGFYGYIADPFLPFFQELDFFGKYPGIYEAVMKTLFLVSGTLLLLNFQVRAMAIIAGITILMVLLSSKPLFRNHILICGCALFLAGLSDREKDPYLLYVQLSIVYLGAFTNKVFQMDWWTGQFIHNWLYTVSQNHLYIFASDLFPNSYFSKGLSWLSMLFEVVIGILLFFKRRHYLVVWLIIIFHGTLFSITTFRFGHFLDDILIYLLVFANWPVGRMSVEYSFSHRRILGHFLWAINWERRIEHTPAQMEGKLWLKVMTDDKDCFNWDGVRNLLLNSPSFYITIFVLDLLIRVFFEQPFQHIAQLMILWGSLIFFLPWGPLLGSRSKKVGAHLKMG
ncbi:MAG: hypothetical protein V7724_06415 [Sediminicola sp.]